MPVFRGLLPLLLVKAAPICKDADPGHKTLYGSTQRLIKNKNKHKECEKHPTVANLEELESAAVLGRVHSKIRWRRPGTEGNPWRMKKNNNPQQAAVAEPPSKNKLKLDGFSLNSY